MFRKKHGPAKGNAIEERTQAQGKKAYDSGSFGASQRAAAQRWGYFRESLNAFGLNMKGAKKFVPYFRTSFYRAPFYKVKNAYMINLSSAKFESPISVALFINKPKEATGKTVQRKIFEVKIAFGLNDEIMIMAMQGKEGHSSELRGFENALGMPTANFLVKEIEEQAKERGFKRVLMTRPEDMSYYKQPHVVGMQEKKYRKLLKPGITEHEARRILEAEEPKLIEKIRKRMRKMYYDVAKARGFVDGGEYLVKDL